MDITLDDLISAIKPKPEWLNPEGKSCGNCINYKPLNQKNYGLCRMDVESIGTISEWYYCGNYGETVNRIIV